MTKKPKKPRVEHIKLRLVDAFKQGEENARSALRTKYVAAGEARKLAFYHYQGRVANSHTEALKELIEALDKADNSLFTHV